MNPLGAIVGSTIRYPDPTYDGGILMSCDLNRMVIIQCLIIARFIIEYQGMKWLSGYQLEARVEEN
jgi:hypothetical protein